jgi:methylglutaconyl-CoA hydratase
LVERDGGILRITLAKPERRNAFDAALIADLHEAFSDVGDARVVVLAGDGPSFCAGADVEWQRVSIDLSFEENVDDALRLYRMMAAVDACPARSSPRRLRARRRSCHARTSSPPRPATFTTRCASIIPAVISPFVLSKDRAGPARRFVTAKASTRRPRSGSACPPGDGRFDTVEAWSAILHSGRGDSRGQTARARAPVRRQRAGADVAGLQPAMKGGRPAHFRQASRAGRPERLSSWARSSVTRCSTRR